MSEVWPSGAKRGDLSLPRQKQVARDAGRRIERAVLVCGRNI